MEDLEQDDEQIDSGEVVLHLEDEQVGEEDTVHVDVVATGPEIEGLSVLGGALLGCHEAQHQDGEGLGARVEEPDPELFHVEDHIVHTDGVEDGRGHEYFVLKLEVEEGVPNVVEPSEGDIVNLIDPLFVHCLARED